MGVDLSLHAGFHGLRLARLGCGSQEKIFYSIAADAEFG
jgi:hypothetical protein